MGCLKDKATLKHATSLSILQLLWLWKK